jgi:hypothetical protein
VNTIKKLRAMAMAFAAWLGKLGLSPTDKWAHAIAGTVAQAVLVLGVGMTALTAAGAVLVLALLKEWIDKRDAGTPDPMDVLATMAAPALWVMPWEAIGATLSQAWR